MVSQIGGFGSHPLGLPCSFAPVRTFALVSSQLHTYPRDPHAQGFASRSTPLFNFMMKPVP